MDHLGRPTPEFLQVEHYVTFDKYEYSFAKGIVAAREESAAETCACDIP
jgi:hypothetical protein